MVDFLLSHEQIANRLADPAIRIVSMTITEGGYFIDPATGEFNSAHPDIQADAASPGKLWHNLLIFLDHDQI
jgi:mannitol 2-dehydrogenase